MTFLPIIKLSFLLLPRFLGSHHADEATKLRENCLEAWHHSWHYESWSLLCLYKFPTIHAEGIQHAWTNANSSVWIYVSGRYLVYAKCHSSWLNSSLFLPSVEKWYNIHILIYVLKTQLARSKSKRYLRSISYISILFALITLVWRYKKISSSQRAWATP